MDILVQELIAAFGGSAIALAAVGWLGRAWLTHRLSIALEQHKNKLSQKAEVLKTELSIYAHEQNVGLSRIDAQRSEAVLAIWNVLRNWQAALSDVTTPDVQTERDNPVQAVDHTWQRAGNMRSLARQLDERIEYHAILFDRDTYATISRCGVAVKTVSEEFVEAIRGPATLAIPAERAIHMPDIQVARSALTDAAAKSIDELREALVMEFRRIMTANPPAKVSEN